MNFESTRVSEREDLLDMIEGSYYMNFNYTNDLSSYKFI